MVDRLPLLLATAVISAGFAQDHCVVTENRFSAAATGHFATGNATVDLTIPLELFDEEWLAVVVSASGDPTGLRIESVEEAIPIRNAAVLKTVPRRGHNPVFSILTRAGERLCSWQPTVFPIQLNRSPALSYEVLMERPRVQYRKIGERFVFLTEGTTPSDTDVFRIGGVPMSVLAYTRDRMIFRDPRPLFGPAKNHSGGLRCDVSIH